MEVPVSGIRCLLRVTCRLPSTYPIPWAGRALFFSVPCGAHYPGREVVCYCCSPGVPPDVMPPHTDSSYTYQRLPAGCVVECADRYVGWSRLPAILLPCLPSLLVNSLPFLGACSPSYLEHGVLEVGWCLPATLPPMPYLCPFCLPIYIQRHRLLPHSDNCPCWRCLLGVA